MRFTSAFLLISLHFSALAQLTNLQTEKLPLYKDAWIDPTLSLKSSNIKVIVWFDRQFLGDGRAYLRRTKEFSSWKRTELRSAVVHSLKSISNSSFTYALTALRDLENSGKISDIRQHWIVNGFSCTIQKGGIEGLRKIPGVAMIYKGLAKSSIQRMTEIGPRILEDEGVRTPALKTVTTTWNIEMLGAKMVWEIFGLSGEGILNIVHDFGFKLDVPGISGSLYRNPNEIPGNDKDDDRNGYVDDYHGYNFDLGSAVINSPNVLRRDVIHGNVCAGVIAGTGSKENPTITGLAPGSKWAGVIGTTNIENSIEWAIEQGADTYSMSFSLPGLGELRSHWRKIFEHATFCGIFFISGAGNFAKVGSPGYASIPLQMRTPEDIPEVVFGVAGVGRDLKRPEFSSQGPVHWDTEHYNEGLVDKPDFATLNSKLPYLTIDGQINRPINGNSLAGPHMTGVIALMLSANKDLLPWDAKKILIETSKDILDEGFDYQSGHGFIDAYAAVKKVLNNKKRNR